MKSAPVLVKLWAAITQADAGGAQTISTDVFGYPATITVSSFLKPAGKLTYDARNLIDGRRQTAWLEGVAGVGSGQSITVQFSHEVPLAAIRFIPGYAKSPRILAGNAVPELELQLAGTRYVLGRPILEHRINFVSKGPYEGEPYVVPTDRPEHYNARYIMLPKGTVAKELKVVLGGALSEVGVAPDNGLSELHVLTDENLRQDPHAVALQYFATNESATLETLEVHPLASKACTGEAAAQPRALLQNVTAKQIWQRVEPNIRVVRTKQG